MRIRLSLQRALVGILIVQAAAALALILYLAVTDRALVLDVQRRQQLRPEERSSLVIPVAGVRPSELTDSYGDPRSGGRSHGGIDIFAAEGTPVVAAATGVIIGRDSSTMGGISLYQRDLDERTVYFYGHLQRYRAGMKEGDLVRQGEVVAYVGQTGNVPPGNPHLHFSIYAVTDPNRWWRGRDLRPCDLLPCDEPEEQSGS